MTDAELLRLFERRARLVADYWKAFNASAPNSGAIMDELKIVHGAIESELAGPNWKPVHPTTEDDEHHPFFRVWRQLQCALKSPTSHNN